MGIIVAASALVEIMEYVIYSLWARVVWERSPRHKFNPFKSYIWNVVFSLSFTGRLWSAVFSTTLATLGKF